MTLVAVAHIVRTVDGVGIAYDRSTHPDLFDDIVLYEDVLPGRLVSMETELVEA